ncbi:predicted protein [Phaeodactylum tricornutum CCAP 1055/1]|uniref:Uncharacterized protein n=1 Tax=Phaeodactylum tricornutum (strain CCAP 1055/1) TaxID=556484 RepID=B5Y437_PHATC|nr:predicted protein [Phaeodactylum tricornutum CCAP 1055/1]ACI65408.1 predicted protein [Phaeodactylum tricornutum CCAP 1055/1]|eukprot:XP_002185938.1 predicted protein [Phaeodactylum tricornutum CCAP 1055/1]
MTARVGPTTATRKLTDAEADTLQTRLRSFMTPGGPEDEEDVKELVEYLVIMVSNQKTAEDAYQEMLEMDMDFCPPATAQNVRRAITEFLQSLDAATTPVETPVEDHADIDNGRVTKIQSSGRNALTMSGALGASRQGRAKNEAAPAPSRRAPPAKDRATATSTTATGASAKTGSGRKSQPPNNNHNNSSANNNNNNSLSRTPREANGAPRRDDRGRAFDRLTPGRSNDGRRSGGRGGPRGGTPDAPLRRRDDGRGLGRGTGPSPRGGRAVGHASGQRRERDDYIQPEEHDFLPAGRGRGSGRGFEGSRGGGGAGRGFDDGGHKRLRLDHHHPGDGGHSNQSYAYDNHHGYYDQGYYDEPGYQPSYRGRGTPRGRDRFGGRGRFPGRGGPPAESGADASEHGGDETAQAAVGHPSPLVQTAFAGRSYSYRGRGRGRGYNPGRVHVQKILAQNTWVRKKDGDGADADAGKE